MELDFWRARWRENAIGWHEDAPNATLRTHHECLALGPGKRVFVPLCGKSTDLAFLAKLGAEVIGSELVPAAAEAFFVEHDLPVTRTVDGPFVRFESGPITILAGDCFDLLPRHVGRVDAVYDRAAVVALPGELRTRYATLLRSLASGAVTLTVTMAHDAPGGPPFSIERDELVRLFGHTNVEPLGETDVFEPGGGLARRGATRTRELAFRIRLTSAP